MEKNPEKAISWVRSAATSPFTRRMLKGTSGWALRSSFSTNAVIKAAEPIKAPMVWMDPQPTTGARTRLNTSNNMPPLTSTAPWVSKSAPPLLAPRSLTTRARVPAATATQIGGLTKKTHRHPGPCDSSPPRNTPAAAAIPLMAPQTPQRDVAVLAFAKGGRQLR